MIRAAQISIQMRLYSLCMSQGAVSPLSCRASQDAHKLNKKHEYLKCSLFSTNLPQDIYSYIGSSHATKEGYLSLPNTSIKPGEAEQREDCCNSMLLTFMGVTDTHNTQMQREIDEAATMRLKDHHQYYF